MGFFSQAPPRRQRDEGKDLPESVTGGGVEGGAGQVMAAVVEHLMVGPSVPAHESLVLLTPAERHHPC